MMKIGCKTLVLFFLVLCLSLANLAAQVMVHEEPFHKPVYQNKELRVLNVVIPPGDTSLYHLHHTPSVFVFFTSSAVGSQLQGKEPVSSKNTAGVILFEDLASPHTRIHKVWNEDKENMLVMDVELFFEGTGFKTPPFSAPKFRLEVDTPWVRGYKVILGDGEDVGFKGRKNSLLLVSLGAAVVEISKGGQTQTEILKAGSFYYIQHKKSFFIKNTASDHAQFALLEFPAR